MSFVATFVTTFVPDAIRTHAISAWLEIAFIVTLGTTLVIAACANRPESSREQEDAMNTPEASVV